MNAHVVLGRVVCTSNNKRACRNEQKGNVAAQQIKQETRNSRVEVMRLDLSSYASVKEFVAEFKRKEIPLHILINNAGLAVFSYAKTVDGNELSFGMKKHCNLKV